MDFGQLLNDLRIDKEETLGRFGNNQALLERFLLKFPADTTMESLKQAVKSNDKEQFELYAHTLKGVSNNLGLTSLGLLCSKAVELVRHDAFSDALLAFPEIQTEYTRITDILNNYKKN